jgi:hypothetical protein
MKNNLINHNELTLSNMIDLRWDEERGIIKIYSVRGKLVRTENGKITYIG